MNADVQCACCSGAVALGGTITLWDGRRYCRPCVDRACELLWQYAQQNEVLLETAPVNWAGQIRRALFMELCICVLFAIPFAISGYHQCGPLGIGIGFMASALLCIVQGAIQIPMFLWMGTRNLPTVSVAEGQLECWRGAGQKPAPHVVRPLNEISWRLGNARQDSLLRSTFVRRKNVVLIETGIKLGWLPIARQRFACGWTDDMRQIWVGFFTLADVPQRRRRC